jgi:ketosteroid isomerase-like protein
MATASLRRITEQTEDQTALESRLERNRRTIQGLVDGFASQDIEAIMALFADNAVYCDILGMGTRGDEYHGKEAIRHAFTRQFDMNGQHTFVDATIMVEQDIAFASWTMVIGDPLDAKAPRFEGIDEFAIDVNGKVTLKMAWLKGLPRLKRTLLTHNPTGLFRHLGYTLKSLLG